MIGNIYLFLHNIISSIIKNKFFSPIGKFLRQILIFVFKCDFDPYLKFKGKVIFPHFIGIVIGKAQIGNNVIIRQNVTIGRKGKNTDKYPTIGDNVEIGAGSIILGDVKIGDNTIIGAGSIITKNIPKNSIVYNNRELVIKKNE